MTLAIRETQLGAGFLATNSALGVLAYRWVGVHMSA